MVRHGSISASVVVDGADLPEYKSRYDSRKRVLSCWIPSEAGKAFKIRLRADRTDYHSNIVFYVDGRLLRDVVCWKHEAPGFTCNSANTSANTESPLLFANNVAAKDHSLLGAQSPSEQGEIRVKHCRVEKLERIKEHQEPHIYEPPDIFDEGSKPVPHITSVGKKRTCAPVKMASHDTREIKHILTVIFYYRPIEHLRARGIAPPAPPPPPTEVDAEDSEDNESAEDYEGEYDDEDEEDDEDAEGDEGVEDDESAEDVVASKRPASSKKRKASSASSESESDSDGEEMVEIRRLNAEIEIKRLELRVAELKEQRRRKKRKLETKASRTSENQRDSATPVKKKNSSMRRKTG
ncbi:hypothetical protein CYLTODRAFT_425069 [Cylindrobasidium torrendii FP15055 ss-10]|uniref:DUF7918 domain-containing protein n=1 Tax=Cylindrobasidium torrendii FP15055 ss-10 TaxID=1314674 RepID=A0A0D7B359_9AGAR|nr:hypothetical protein CYLTODRAFT_425069 [Cylindrobasidium torrendii FP15055 ss-10]